MKKTFLVAIEREEVFRFACKGKLVTSLKLSGLIRLTIPPWVYGRRGLDEANTNSQFIFQCWENLGGKSFTARNDEFES